MAEDWLAEQVEGVHADGLDEGVGYVHGLLFATANGELGLYDLLLDRIDPHERAPDKVCLELDSRKMRLQSGFVDVVRVELLVSRRRHGCALPVAVVVAEVALPSQLPKLLALWKVVDCALPNHCLTDENY